MYSLEEKLKEFAVELFKIGAIKFGDFKTKIGLPTPIYCDLRVIVSYPKVLESLSNLLVDFMKTLSTFDVICGVPYTALPIATAISMKNNIPMVMRRKEAKSYGTKNLIEGVYHENASCLIIEDVVTSGSSILETVKDLTNADLKCTHAIVVLNREQGGADYLKDNGIEMHALFTISNLLKYLKQENCIENSTIEKIHNYLKSTQISTLTKNNDGVLAKGLGSKLDRMKLPYLERIQYCKNPTAKKLFQIMHDKQTNLCLSADVTQSADLFQLVEETGSEICMLKTHIDILEDFSSNTVTTLKSLAEKYNFILLEDRKFGDIGQIVQLQFTSGLYKISSWADAITAHSLTGKGLLDGIKNSGNDSIGVFLLAQTSAADNLIDEKYTKQTLALAEEYSDLLCGFVCQSPLFLEQPGLVHLIPGVQLESTGDSLGQQYNSPEYVMLKCGGDVAVVGRGITKAANKKEAAAKYKHLLFESYKRRLL